MLTKLLQKTPKTVRNTILGLPLILGMGLTSPAEAKNGYVDISGKYILLEKGDPFLKETYADAFGGSVGLGFNLNKNVIFGGDLSFLVGEGDYEIEEGWVYKKEKTQDLSIFTFGPWIEFTGNSKISPFLRIGYEFDKIIDKLRTQKRTLTRKSDYPDSYKDIVHGSYAEVGGKVDFKLFNKKITTDGAIKGTFGYRGVPKTKGPYFKIGAQFNF